MFEKGAPALFQSWVTELLTKYLGVSWWGSGTHPVFLILEPSCLSALLFWLLWMQVSCCCCLVQGLFPFNRTFLFFPSRFWFWQLGNCPVPKFMGRPSMSKSLVSSSFLQVTALRTGEELLMRGSKARLGGLLRWDQGRNKLVSNSAKIWTGWLAVVLSGKSKIPVKLGSIQRQDWVT